MTGFRTALFGLVFALLSVAAPLAAEPADRTRFSDRPAEVSRHFAEGDGAQIHYRRAGAASDHAPLVLLHQSPNSSQIFVEFMAEMGADRIVYAPDTSGFGQSDLPSAQPDIAAYASAMAQFMDASALGKVDLLGYHTGAAIAIEIARQHPERVRRLILVGIPAFTPAEADAFDASPWPRPLDAEGVQIAEEWKRSLQWRGKGQSDASVRRTFDQKIANGPMAFWGARAALRYPTQVALSEVEAPILFIRPRDDLWESSLRVLPELEALGAQRLDLPQYGFGLFETAPEELAAIARDFLDGDQP